MRTCAWILAFAAASLLTASDAIADGTWDGGGGTGSPNWSVAVNWAGDILPNTNGSGTITFTNTAIAASNVVDVDWKVTTLRYYNNAFGQAHTTYIESGRSLVVTNGSLTAGENRSNCWAEIRGGTLQLGADNRPSSLSAGAHTVLPASGGYTNNRLMILSDINGANWSNLWVGRQTAASQSTPADGLLDVSGAAITTLGEASKLKLAGGLVVGGGSGRNPNGVLRLPPALTEIDVASFELAAGSLNQIGWAALDLGANSQLKKFTVRGDCYFGRNGIATVTGWPTGVDMTVGQPGAPAALVVGSSQANVPVVAGQLALTNGSFTAWLSSLKVGSQPYTGASAVSSGILDLASTTVAIGGATNMILVNTLSIGGDHGRGPNGILLLPAAITNMTVGLFEVGAGSGGFATLATLDFGENSKLRTLTVTNDFALGNPGSAFLVHFPTNVVIRVGQPARPVQMVVGLSEGGGSLTRFAPTNASLTAWLSSFRIGCNTYSGGGTPGSMDTELDLSTCQVQIGDVPDMVTTPEFRVGGQGGRYIKALLKLPASITNITVGVFEVGNGYPTAPTSFGILDLGAGSQLKTLTASNGLTMGQGGYGAVQGLPANVDVTVGAPGTPAPLLLGNTTLGSSPCGILVLNGGTFKGWLSQLKLGCNTYATGGAGITGILDLASATVETGGKPNSLGCPEIRLGGDKGRNGNGLLRLPATVTNMAVGILEIGAGAGTSFANGVLDFSAESGLKTFVISNALTMGYIGLASITNLPPGVAVRIGNVGAPVPVVIGWTSNSAAGTQSVGLRLPFQARFAGVMSTLDIAISEHTYQNAILYAYLDTSNGFLDGLTVTGDVRIGYSMGTSNVNGRGFFSLPAGDVTIGGNLFLGDTHGGSRGILCLDGTRVAVGGRVALEAGTGFVTNWLSGASGGIDLLNADTNNLTIASGGKMALQFTADPVSRVTPYWGLRMRGNATGYFQGLTSSPARVVYDATALSESVRKFLGVHYDVRTDTTFLGVPAINSGTVIQIR